MAEESNENIAKSGENPTENGVKVKESGKTSVLTNGKTNGEAVHNGSSKESGSLIISQKHSPTQAHKSLHTSPHKSSCTTEASLNSSNHVAHKADEKSKVDSKTPHATPSKDRKSRDEHGK